MTIDDYIAERNRIQLAAEQVSEERARVTWEQLATANRHIERVLRGTLELSPAVEDEIRAAFRRALHQRLL